MMCSLTAVSGSCTHWRAVPDDTLTERCFRIVYSLARCFEFGELTLLRELAELTRLKGWGERDGPPVTVRYDVWGSGQVRSGHGGAGPVLV